MSLYTKCYITGLKLGSSTEFILLFPFLVLTKSQVLNVRLGRTLSYTGSIILALH